MPHFWYTRLSHLWSCLVAIGATVVVYVADDIQNEGYLSKSPTNRPEESPMVLKLEENARKRKDMNKADGEIKISVPVQMQVFEKETLNVDNLDGAPSDPDKRLSKFEEIFGDDTKVDSLEDGCINKGYLEIESCASSIFKGLKTETTVADDKNQSASNGHLLSTSSTTSDKNPVISADEICETSKTDQERSVTDVIVSSKRDDVEISVKELQETSIDVPETSDKKTSDVPETSDKKTYENTGL